MKTLTFKHTLSGGLYLHASKIMNIHIRLNIEVFFCLYVIVGFG